MSTKKYIFMNWYKTAQSFGDLLEDESGDMVSVVIEEIDFKSFEAEFSQTIDAACKYIKSTATNISGMWMDSASDPGLDSEIRKQAGQWIQGLYNMHRDKAVVEVYVNHSISNMKLYPRVPMTDAWKLGEIVTCTVMALWSSRTFAEHTLAEITILSRGGVWKTLAEMIDEGKINNRGKFIETWNELK